MKIDYFDRREIGERILRTMESKDKDALKASSKHLSNYFDEGAKRVSLLSSQESVSFIILHRRSD